VSFSSGARALVDWTEEMIKFVRDALRINSRMPCRMLTRRVNERFGTDFSNSAIISKINRLHLGNARNSKVIQPTERKAGFAEQFKVERLANIRVAKLRAVKKKLPPKGVRPAQSPNKVLANVASVFKPNPDKVRSFLALGEGCCKWPVGEEVYCGETIAERRQPYCPYHMRVRTKGRNETEYDTVIHNRARRSGTKFR